MLQELELANRLLRARAVVLSIIALSASSCADMGPRIDDRFAVYTPIFADNRVYYLKKRDASTKKQALEPLGAPQDPGEEVVPRNSPLSVILRSVEIPTSAYVDAQGRRQDNSVRDRADYAVILDIGTNADGSSQSIVVWYQRGVRTDQSLNFSNLLVYYEPRWDERVAPYFRFRVMDVTTERNAETRRALERAHNIGSSLGALGANPMVSPLIGIAFTAAELVLANRQNRMLLDYSVQLYSSSAAAQAGSGELGVLKRGSYIVVGRPNAESREFWLSNFRFQPESRILEADTKRVQVPLGLITVGTFDSIVPTIVVERSAALTKLLTTKEGASSIEQMEKASQNLAASVGAFTLGERLTRYRSAGDVDQILKKLSDSAFRSLLGSEDEFFLVRAINNCFSPAKSFTSIADVEAYRIANPTATCKPR
jgi:hypothetical protein